MDIARYERNVKTIVPVGAVTKIQYFPPKRQQQSQEEKREHPFHVMFEMKLREAPMDENQSFQAYC